MFCSNNTPKNQNEVLGCMRHITVIQLSFNMTIFNFMWANVSALKTHLSPCQQLDQYFNIEYVILSWTSFVYQWVLHSAGKLFDFFSAVVLIWGVSWREVELVWEQWRFQLLYFHFDSGEGEQVFKPKKSILAFFWRPVLTLCITLAKVGGKREEWLQFWLSWMHCWISSRDCCGRNRDGIGMVSSVGEKANTNKTLLGLKCGFKNADSTFFFLPLSYSGKKTAWL